MMQNNTVPKVNLVLFFFGPVSLTCRTRKIPPFGERSASESPASSEILEDRFTYICRKQNLNKAFQNEKQQQPTERFSFSDYCILERYQRYQY